MNIMIKSVLFVIMVIVFVCLLFVVCLFVCLLFVLFQSIIVSSSSRTNTITYSLLRIYFRFIMNYYKTKYCLRLLEKINNSQGTYIPTSSSGMMHIKETFWLIGQ